MALALLPTASFAQGFVPIWSALGTSGPLPAARRDMPMCYDSRRDQVLIVDATSTTRSLGFLPGSVWQNLNVTAPSEFDFSRGVYDSVHDRFVFVTASMHVFALTLDSPAGWQRLVPSTAEPPTRTFFATTYDPLRNRILVFGGGPYTGLFNDLWAFELDGTNAWVRLDVGGTPPPPAWGPLLIYDALHDRVIAGMGSVTSFYSPTADLYSLSLSTPTAPWSVLPVTGAAPSPRMLTSAAYDPVGRRLVLFSGYPGALPDAFQLALESGADWSQLVPIGGPPPSRWSSDMVYRSSGSQMVLVGGHNTFDFMDAWALQLDPATAAPLVLGFSPTGGDVGQQVLVGGANFDSALDVSFNGVNAPILQKTYDHLLTQVPAGATTGPITVTNPSGAGTSSTDFIVGPSPTLDQVSPDSAHTGDTVSLTGSHLSGITRVRFGGTGAASFQVVSDAQVSVLVDSLASSGPITVDAPTGTVTSTFSFLVLADDPRPHLLSVRDIAGDQGGKVMLLWRASDFDQSRYRSVTGYRVWRRAPQAPATPEGALPAGWMAVRCARAGAANDLEFWESIAQLPAAFLRGYAYAAATLSDSVGGDPPYTSYFVQALTADPFTFYNSSPDSGYSVDNLAPPTPGAMAVQYAPNSNLVRWTARRVPDLARFQLYRGGSAEFVPSPATLVAETLDSTYADVAGPHHYKLRAIDIHGNGSRFVSVSPDRPVATYAAFLDFMRESGRVRLRWFSGGNAGLVARVYRRAEEGDWEYQRSIVADGTGYLRFEDASVADSRSYDYRLGIDEPEQGEVIVGEAHVPALASALQWSAAPRNPSLAGRIELSLSVPAGEALLAEVFDVSGRLVESARSEGSGGPRAITFGAAHRLRAGVYLVRVSAGSARLSRRIVLLD